MKYNSMYDHHPWCNHYTRQGETCSMCDGEEGLFAKYPLKDENGNPVSDLMAKYFPDNIRRT